MVVFTDFVSWVSCFPTGLLLQKVLMRPMSSSNGSFVFGSFCALIHFS